MRPRAGSSRTCTPRFTKKPKLPALHDRAWVLRRRLGRRTYLDVGYLLSAQVPTMQTVGSLHGPLTGHMLESPGNSQHRPGPRWSRQDSHECPSRDSTYLIFMLVP